MYKDHFPLEQTNATEDQIHAVISREHEQMRDRLNSSSINTFFLLRTASRPSRPSRQSQTSRTIQPSAAQCFVTAPISGRAPDKKLIQAVGIILYGCMKQATLSNLSCPMIQGLIHVCDGRMRFSIQKIVQGNAICRLLKGNTEDSIVGSITSNWWSAALRASVLGITWHYVDIFSA